MVTLFGNDVGEGHDIARGGILESLDQYTVAENLDFIKGSDGIPFEGLVGSLAAHDNVEGTVEVGHCGEFSRGLGHGAFIRRGDAEVGCEHPPVSGFGEGMDADVSLAFISLYLYNT